MEGIVVKSTGSWYLVKTETGETVEARIKGKFRLQGLKLTNPVAVGDKVELESIEGDMRIVKIHPRTNYIVRQSPRKRMYLHLIASNLDQIFLISTIREPNLKPGFIDRFLVTAESHSIPTVIILNKADIFTEEDLDIFEGLKWIYEEAGYPVIAVSALEGTNVDVLQEMLKDKTTLIVGHSGVGKSTLSNALDSTLKLRTNEISNNTGKGQHTTTFAEMHTLQNGGQIIDTPGIKGFGFINMEPMEIAHNFKEIFKHSSECKFADCLHVNEPKCAVKEAVETGAISESRFYNYLSILEDVQSQNYWERNQDW